jgi:hypothetical protein
MQPTSSTPMVTRGDLAANEASFARHLRPENLSPATLHTYLAALTRLAEFLGVRGMPTDVAAIRRSPGAVPGRFR